MGVNGAPKGIRTIGDTLSWLLRATAAPFRLCASGDKQGEGVTIHLDTEEVIEIARELNGSGPVGINEERASELLRQHSDRLAAVMRREAHYLIEELLVTSST